MKIFARRRALRAIEALARIQPTMLMVNGSGETSITGCTFDGESMMKAMASAGEAYNQVILKRLEVIGDLARRLA